MITTPEAQSILKQAFIEVINSPGLLDVDRLNAVTASFEDLLLNEEGANQITWKEKGAHKTETARIGRFLTTKVFPHLSTTYPDYVKEEIVSTVQAMATFDMPNVEVVKGEAIRWAYHEDNYTSNDYSELHDSCMRYAGCQDFLDIYVQNPEVVSLAIIRDSNAKVAARSLLWHSETKTYMDRIYADAKTKSLMKVWAKRLGIQDIYYKRFPGIVIPLNRGNFKYYPYLDTFDQLNRGMDGSYFLTRCGHFPQHISTSTIDYQWDLISTGGGPVNFKDTCPECDAPYDDHLCLSCDYCVECDNCGSSQGIRTVNDRWGGEVPICEECYENKVGYCSDCKKFFLDLVEATTVEGNHVCIDCAEKRHPSTFAAPYYCNLSGFWNGHQARFRHVYDIDQDKFIPAPSTNQIQLLTERYANYA